MQSKIIEKNMFFGAKRELFEKARGLRKNMTQSEVVLWKKLKNRDLFKIKFRRQHPIDHFIVDFYCHEVKMVIEVDGGSHNDDTRDYDLGREADLKRYGIQILRFSNDQVLYEMDSVIKKIHAKIYETDPL